MQARPIASERRVGAGRVAIVSLICGFAIVLAGCGEDDTTAAAGAAPSGNTSTSSTVPPTVADTTSQTSKGGGSTTTAVAPTPVPPPKAPSQSSITLGWIPPTQNNDGSPITNLAGYKIHYGTASSKYTQTVALQNAGLTRYVVDNLPSGTYYFAITAYNSHGVESTLSGEIATTVD